MTNPADPRAPGAPPQPAEERFWSKVVQGDGCWEWSGTRDGGGYGSFSFGGRTVKAHRWSYELAKGPIPAGLNIDHLCRNRACVNPDHLEAVTNKVNVLRGEGATAANARKTHCKRGHPLSGSNLGNNKRGRYCKKCKREKDTEWNRRDREGGYKWVRVKVDATAPHKPLLELARDQGLINTVPAPEGGESARCEHLRGGGWIGSEVCYDCGEPMSYEGTASPAPSTLTGEEERCQHPLYGEVICGEVALSPVHLRNYHQFNHAFQPVAEAPSVEALQREDYRCAVMCEAADNGGSCRCVGLSENVALRAQVAALTTERDEARAWQSEYVLELEHAIETSHVQVAALQADMTEIRRTLNERGHGTPEQRIATVRNIASRRALAGASPQDGAE